MTERPGAEPPAEERVFDVPGTGSTSRVRFVPKAERWVERAMRTHGSLYAAARADHLVERSGGRGPVYEVVGQGETWAVRHYRRGGAFGGLLDDRYVAASKPRPFREQDTARQLRARGVRTPAVLAAAVYPSGAVYRGDLVTTWIAGSRPLLEELAGPGRSEPVLAVPALNLAGRLARTLGEAEAYHVDFNASNILLAEAPTHEADRAWVIDLDRCRMGIRHPKRAVGRMIARLERSIRKTVTGGEALPAAWQRALRDGAA